MAAAMHRRYTRSSSLLGPTCCRGLQATSGPSRSAKRSRPPLAARRSVAWEALGKDFVCLPSLLLGAFHCALDALPRSEVALGGPAPCPGCSPQTRLCARSPSIGLLSIVLRGGLGSACDRPSRWDCLSTRPTAWMRQPGRVCRCQLGGRLWFRARKRSGVRWSSPPSGTPSAAVARMALGVRSRRWHRRWSRWDCLGAAGDGFSAGHRRGSGRVASCQIPALHRAAVVALMCDAPDCASARRLVAAAHGAEPRSSERLADLDPGCGLAVLPAPGTARGAPCRACAGSRMLTRSPRRRSVRLPRPWLRPRRSAQMGGPSRMLRGGPPHCLRLLRAGGLFWAVGRLVGRPIWSRSCPRVGHTTPRTVVPSCCCRWFTECGRRQGPAIGCAAPGCRVGRLRRGCGPAGGGAGTSA